MRSALLVLLMGCGSSPSPVLPPPATLTLTATPFVPGEPTTLTVEGLLPGNRAHIARALNQAPGICVPSLGGVCLDIDGGEAYVGSVRANASGTAQMTFTVPTTLAVGTEGWFQAASLNQGVGVKSDPLHVLIEEAAYTLCDGAQEVFDVNCTACHGAGAFGGLDLRDATSVVGVASPTVSMDWVDPDGDPEASYLWRKIAGTHGDVPGGGGGAMPPSGTLSAWDRQRVEDWVVAGGECVTVEPETAPPFAPSPAATHRMTGAQYRRAVHDLFGVDFEGILPPDYVLYGYDTVGAGVLGMSPSELETYEAAAWEVATAAVGTDPSAFFGCPTDQQGCIRSWLSEVSQRAWRQPATTDELDAIMDIYADLSNPIEGAQAIVASVLLSPRFLFHIEVASSDGDWRSFSGWERAGRLGLFLLGSVPDEALVQAAKDGTLDTPAGLRAEAERLLQTERGRTMLSDWFGQSMDLPRLDAIDKDPSVGVLTESLKQEMRDEYDAIFRHMVFDAPQDFRDILTTDLTMAGPGLSALYGMPAGTGLRQLPDPDRGGALGRAGILSVHAHSAETSPTRRGKFVHTRMLCRGINPPPEGVVTSLEGVAVGASMRQRLEQHMSDPVCASCHTLMDPMGFAFEHYGPMGARRELDNGHVIDASGELDGESFSSAVELARVVHDHAEYSRCMVRQMYRYAVGQREPDSIDAAVLELEGDWAASGHDLQDLVVSLITHDGFAKATAPSGGSCSPVEAGDVRPCAADCGDGVETCNGLIWTGCTAQSGDWETCNGIDDDCDGQIDQGVERACEAVAGPGTQVCTDGAWEACSSGDPTAETCNGWDDDHDGRVDEGLDIDTRTVDDDFFPGCIPTDPHSQACREAAQSICADSDCSISGWGPLSYDPLATTIDLTCVSDQVANTQWASWSTLAASHPGCSHTGFDRGSCNAAINRRCAALGHVSGFGPTTYDANGAAFTCVTQGNRMTATFGELSTFVATCDGSTDRVGGTCVDAINQLCITRGFASGFGPTEHNGDNAYFVCMGTSEAGPISRPEICNNWDDDLDGVVDDGLEVGGIIVSTSELPGCSGANPSDPACREGAHAVCAAEGCALSGFGPVEHNAPANQFDVTCVDDDTSVSRTETWATLAASHPGCSSTAFWTGDCNAAISRRCASLGHVSGFGPTTYDATGATYVCVDDAQTMGTTYTDLSTFIPSCDGTTDRVGLPCNAAINRLCKTRGFAGGFGPNENSGNAASVTCVGDGTPTARAETCNGWDDDLDGVVDDGLDVSLRSVPASSLPNCDPNTPVSAACRAGARQVCATESCWVSGIGPIRANGGNVEVACLSDSATAQRTETWAGIATSHPACNSPTPGSGPCNAAISRRCRSLGFDGGYGPTTYDGNVLNYDCVSDGHYVISTFTTLATHNASCVWNDPTSASCADAISSYCESQGYVTGTGPAEHSNNDVHFLCMGDN